MWRQIEQKQLSYKAESISGHEPDQILINRMLLGALHNNGKGASTKHRFVEKIDASVAL